MSKVAESLEHFMRGLRKRNPHEDEFCQAVHDLAVSVMPVYLERPELRRAQILERMTEPDRIITFRVTWQTDSGDVRAQRAWRVQFNHALGPYKGGLRFHPSVTQSVLKFLGFEQVFKNALTGLPMGGAKGGSNFNPRGKSEAEVMRFCHALMDELHRHIGEHTDVPAGDIGVGEREVGFLFGRYMHLENRWSGVITGKHANSGGSAGRTEATGYGCVDFLERMLARHDEGLEGRTVLVSGAGNVALHAAERVLERGGKLLTLSDSGGLLHAEQGFDAEQLAELKQLKLEGRGRLEEYAEQAGKGVRFHEGERPWGLAADVALPCATQNELTGDDAERLVANGVRAVCEGANMPTTPEAVEVFRRARVLHAPGKASNAGGVAVSGLEQSQNAMRTSWTREEVERRLQAIMASIHDRCVEHGEHDGRVDYVHGANRAGFLEVAAAMLAHGVL